MDFTEKLNAFYKELRDKKWEIENAADGGFYDPRVRALQIAISVLEAEMSAFRHGKSVGEGVD